MVETNRRTKEDWQKLNVSMGDEVDPSRIAADVVIHPGCRILGSETSIGPGSEIGAEGPVTLENCQLGRGVKLKGGYFSGATFFDGANMGSGAHVRAGTILEEEANGAHTVGLKQTILFPFVTLGSLINFCDVFMAGGTSRKDHSEVGSSYIHFNYTPNKDKATASLAGDVARGVFLTQKPIFLGGQGGLVGPRRLAYGTIVAAGGICRKDVLEESQLHIPATPEAKTITYETGVYRRIGSIVKNNLLYIGNLVALREWYQKVRAPLMGRDEFDRACLEGGLKNLDLILQERIKRLGEVAANMDYSIRWMKQNLPFSEPEIQDQQRFVKMWPDLNAELKNTEQFQNELAQERFLAAFGKLPPKGSYTETIQSLDEDLQRAGELWLQSMVDHIGNLWSA